MNFKTPKIILIALLFLGTGVVRSLAKTDNGNDFALYYTECATGAERKALLDDAKGRPHFFRYLQIMEMEKGEQGGRPFIAVLAFEPASFMDVKFYITKRISLDKLSEEPRSAIGDAIAVTGVIESVDTNTITLSSAVVRYKDRLTPKRGKEMLYEVDPSGTFYSYSGGKKAVSITYKDRDLLQYRDQVLAEKGKQGWTDFLTLEVEKRNKARELEAKKYKAKQP